MAATTHSFRPKHKSLFGGRRWWLILAVGVLALYPGYYKLVHLNVSPLIAIAILLGALIAVLLPIWLLSEAWYATATLEVDTDRIVYRALGRHRSWPIADVKRLVRGRILVLNLQAPDQLDEQLLFIGSTGRCILRLGAGWSHGRIAHAIGLPLEQIPSTVITAGDASRAYPGSYSWSVAHPGGRYLVGLGLGAVGCGIIVVIVLLTERG